MMIHSTPVCQKPRWMWTRAAESTALSFRESPQKRLFSIYTPIQEHNVRDQLLLLL